VTAALLGLPLIAATVAMSLAMSFAFIVARRTGNSGWIDVVWTFGLGATGVIVALLPVGDGPLARRLVVAALVAAWALRLGLHLAFRTRGISDDPRYAKLKRNWGEDANWQLFRLLQLQALASVPLALAIILAAQNPEPALGFGDVAGILVFAIGIAGGAIADLQMRRFKGGAALHGEVCDAGLWAWSRHPNYFFECVLWGAYPVIAISASGYPFGWAALLAPLCMTLLLTRISGIPPLEDHMLDKYGPAYRIYQQRTSAFLPLPPAR
jgi:steroid 5-alpha reductase family enzyme